ncbi:MAG: InlB B-repeat-containing protein, partial [Lachnospiraceae bacterium]|nr:InlB B-repeat-containing protein [Lachnospiraceae bacterium]
MKKKLNLKGNLKRWIAFLLAVVLIVTTCVYSSDAHLRAEGGVEPAETETVSETETIVAEDITEETSETEEGEKGESGQSEPEVTDDSSEPDNDITSGEEPAPIDPTEGNDGDEGTEAFPEDSPEVGAEETDSPVETESPDPSASPSVSPSAAPVPSESPEVKDEYKVVFDCDSDKGTVIVKEPMDFTGFEDMVEKESTVKFAVEPKDGYQVDEVRVKGNAEPAEADGDGIYTLEINSDTNVKVAFAEDAKEREEDEEEELQDSYNVTISTSENGTVTVNAAEEEAVKVASSCSTTVEEGTAISFTVEPDEGYTGSVAVDGKSADAASISENSSTYELNIKSDTEVEVTFTAEEEKEDEDEEVKEYTVTINVPEAKGAVTVNTLDESVDATNGFSGTVEKGSSLIFDVEPDEGYMIGRVAVNGKAVSAASTDENVSTYELNEINVDTVINIYFGTDNLGISNIINSLYGVTALAETSSNSITCTVGESKKILKPTEKWNCSWEYKESEIISVVKNSDGSITVTGKNIGEATIICEYGTGKNEKTVTYNIKVITPKVKITYEAGIGGSVSSKGEELEAEAENAQGSTAEAANGCVFYNWTDEKSEPVGSEETFVPSKPENGFVETTYTANFVEAEDIMIQFGTVDSNAGTVSNSSQSLKPISGTAVSVTATPKLGYKFEKWTNDEGKTVSTNATFTPEKIDGVYVAQTYTAHFTKINVSEQTAYFYVGVPGATTDVPNESWYGMGTGTIKVDNKAEAYGLGTRLNELLNQEGAISFPGEYPSITDKGNNKIYKYSVDRKEPGTYYITWNEVIVSPGANNGANGYNPEINAEIKTFHVDGTLHFVDQETHEVHFMCYIPGEEGFQYIKTSGEIGDEGSYIRIDDGGHENEINKPSMIEREGYKFDGWYTDAAFENKALFDGVITENKTYYGRYVEDESQRKTLSYTVKYYKGNSDELDELDIHSQDVWVHQSDALKVEEGSINTKDKYPGYKLDYIEVGGERVSEIPDVVDDGTEISVYYVVDDEQRHTVSAQVEYYYGDTLDEAKEKDQADDSDEMVTQTEWIGSRVSVTVEPNTENKFVGYKYVETEGDLSYAAEELAG